ncbi:MAG: hypothetical protein ABW161_16890 [Candidatus Thiodiazotropha sp.]
MANKQTPGGSTRPVIKQTVELGSFPAQQSFNRSYAYTSRSLYMLSVVLRPLTSEENVSKVEERVDELLSEMEKRFADEIKRLIALCNKSGIDPQPNFTKPVTVDVEIATPRASRYLGLIKQLDHIIGLIAVLWISGVRTDKQYSDECYLWQRNLARLSNRMREIISRAVSAGNREKRERVEAAKGVKSQPDPDPQEALNDDEAIETVSAQEVDGSNKEASEKEPIEPKTKSKSAQKKAEDKIEEGASEANDEAQEDAALSPVQA